VFGKRALDLVFIFGVHHVVVKLDIYFITKTKKKIKQITQRGKEGREKVPGRVILSPTKWPLFPAFLLRMCKFAGNSSDQNLLSFASSPFAFLLSLAYFLIFLFMDFE